MRKPAIKYRLRVRLLKVRKMKLRMEQEEKWNMDLNGGQIHCIQKMKHRMNNLIWIRWSCRQIGMRRYR